MWIFKAFRTIATFLSLYILYKGLQLGSMKAALPYILPGAFWFAYYYYLVREVLNEGEVSLEERVWYILFLMIGITTLFVGTALSSTGRQFLVSVIIWIFILVILGRAEERIKKAIRTLRTRSSILLPMIFAATGTLVYMVVPDPLNLTYLLTFIAIGVTVYEWDLEKMQNNNDMI